MAMMFLYSVNLKKRIESYFLLTHFPSPGLGRNLKKRIEREHLACSPDIGNPVRISKRELKDLGSMSCSARNLTTNLKKRIERCLRSNRFYATSGQSPGISKRELKVLPIYAVPLSSIFDRNLKKRIERGRCDFPYTRH